MTDSFFLVSQNDIAREGLSHILNGAGFTISGCYQSVSEIPLDEIGENSLIAIDVADATSELLAVKEINSFEPTASVVVLVDNFDLDSMLDCFHAGAQGYILKTMRVLPLVAALQLAALGEKVYPSELLEAIDRQKRSPFPLLAEREHNVEDANLSKRERDVLCCLMAGYSNKVIARELELCEATVKVHVKAILRKLKVQNRTQAAIWANSHGMSQALALT